MPRLSVLPVAGGVVLRLAGAGGALLIDLTAEEATRLSDRLALAVRAPLLPDPCDLVALATPTRPM